MTMNCEEILSNQKIRLEQSEQRIKYFLMLTMLQWITLNVFIMKLLKSKLMMVIVLRSCVSTHSILPRYQMNLYMITIYFS